MNETSMKEFHHERQTNPFHPRSLCRFAPVRSGVGRLGYAQHAGGRDKILPGGDQGWVLIPHEYAYRDGKWQHVDKLQHNTPAPSVQMTPEEKKQREALYQGG